MICHDLAQPSRPTHARQTFDDALLELHRGGVDIFSVAYQKPKESPLARLGAGGSAALLPGGLPRRAGWGARLLHALLGGAAHEPLAPSHHHPGAEARMHDARYDPSLQ